jgi:hypothetical protein
MRFTVPNSLATLFKNSLFADDPIRISASSPKVAQLGSMPTPKIFACSPKIDLQISSQPPFWTPISRIEIGVQNFFFISRITSS